MPQLSYLRKWIGVELDPVSLREKLISGLGGLFAIFLLITVTHHWLSLTGAAMLITSMGATAVLLFAVPHSQLSQPWPVLAGHGFAALIGVFSARHIPHIALAAGCAVGLTVFIMHHLKCIHPPGGATALAAVVGGPDIHALGYAFAWTPVLLNAALMVLLAIIFNFAFKWRRYPAFWNAKPKARPAEPTVTHEEVVSALESFDSFVDISEDDLIRLHQLLSRRVSGKS